MENSKNETGWKRHFTPKNMIINGLIALIPASLIIGILRELGFGGALLMGSVIFVSMYLVCKIREIIKKSRASFKN